MLGFASLLLGAAGCSYAVHMHLQVLDTPQSDRGRALFMGAVERLRQGNDGCYSSRRADYTLVADDLSQLAVHFVMKERAVDVSMALDWQTGIVRATLNERTEPRLSPVAAQCYRQLHQVLRERYGERVIHLSESCKQQPCL